MEFPKSFPIDRGDKVGFITLQDYSISWFCSKLAMLWKRPNPRVLAIMKVDVYFVNIANIIMVVIKAFDNCFISFSFPISLIFNHKIWVNHERKGFSQALLTRDPIALSYWNTLPFQTIYHTLSLMKLTPSTNPFQNQKLSLLNLVSQRLVLGKYIAFRTRRFSSVRNLQQVLTNIVKLLFLVSLISRSPSEMGLHNSADLMMWNLFLPSFSPHQNALNI